ncbi:MAG: hypothetical protein LAT67_15635, partial [Balneolales bacterium]|nr:hypothetical protein [Balneolales bacterium]
SNLSRAGINYTFDTASTDFVTPDEGLREAVRNPGDKNKTQIKPSRDIFEIRKLTEGYYPNTSK